MNTGKNYNHILAEFNLWQLGADREGRSDEEILNEVCSDGYKVIADFEDGYLLAKAIESMRPSNDYVTYTVFNELNFADHKQIEQLINF